MIENKQASQHLRRIGRVYPIVMLLCLVLLVFSGCERIQTPTFPDVSTPDSAVHPLTVMTYNVYVGANFEKLLGLTNLLEVPTEVANVYDQTIASDFPARAKAIAVSIKTHHPHLIGLQEISILRRQSPGDRLSGGIAAEDVILDFLSILMDALAAEGLSYEVAAKVENFDVEMPMFTADGGLDDVRLTDFDVILARSDVSFSRPTSENYTNTFPVEQLFFEVKRGFTAIDATVNGYTLRFVTTHLESFDKEVRLAQTQELIKVLERETLPILLLGDFNSPTPDGTGYQMLRTDEYIDIWQADSEGSGNTSYQAADLRNENSSLSERIDLIFVRNWEGEVSAITNTVGDKADDRLPNGLWPSDHAGVVAHLLLE